MEGDGCIGGGEADAAAGAAGRSCASFSFRHAANCFMSCAAVAWIMPTPRPYCATAPDSVRLVCTSTLDPSPAGSSRKREAALAPPRPFASVPCAATRAVWAASSICSNLTMPAKVKATGPSRTPILPLYVFWSTTSVSSAPGMHGAMRWMSSSTFHASSGGSGTSNELSNSIPRSILARARGRGARDAAEHRARGQAGAAGIVEIEQSPDQFAGGIEAADRLVVGIEHLGVGGDAHAAEGEGEAAGHRVALERRLVDGVRPVALVDGKALGAPAVLDVRIERNVAAHGLIVFGDGLEKLLRVYAVELAREFLDRIGDDLGDLPDLVLVALQMLHLLVEDLPGELAGLLQHHAAVFGVGVVAEVGAFVDEALAGGVDEDRERVGMFLKLVADREIAKLGRVHLPLHGVTAGPVAAGARADIHRHADAVAGVEARAAHLGEVPAGPEVTRAPLGIGFEADAREHDRCAAQLAFDARMPNAHAHHPHAVMDEAKRARAVTNLDALFGRGVGEHLDETGSAPDRLDGEAAPELELALDLERLAAIDRDEAHVLGAQPAEGVAASGHQQLDQVGIGAILRHPRHVVEKLLLRIGAEIGGGDFLLRQIRHQRLDVFDAVVNDPHRSRGEPAVAAGFLLGRCLQHQHRRALFARRQRRAKGRVAAAHDDDISLRFRHLASHDAQVSSALLVGARLPASAGTATDRCAPIIHLRYYSAAAVAAPPWAFDQPAGSCMKFSISASFAASNLPLSLATASTSHQVASACSVTPRSLRIFRASGKMS